MASRTRSTASRSTPSGRQKAGDGGSFHGLSMGDLLDARDAYHIHLSHLDNVVATAIGLYRIARGDPDVARPDVERSRERGRAVPRTLANSVVTPWSWPCVLVFVRAWIGPEERAKKFDEIVPPRLYLPDGRVIPTCVVLAERRQKAPAVAGTLRFPASAIGGGYPVLADVQCVTHVGTLACLVTDGDRLFALTDRHVAGEPGRELYTLLQGEPDPIGRSDPRQLGHLPFEQVYPGWKGTRTRTNLDAGLIELSDARLWTSQIYGIGEFDELADLHVDTLGLGLIGRKVRAYGAASGLLRGEVQALFYRYRSVGGLDYVADLLIGPDPTARTPLAGHGNSGALWLLEEEPDPNDATRPANAPPKLHPLALHWGGQTLVEPGGETETEFALATLVSTICRELDVDVVRDLNVGLPQTWGKLGHYKIGAAACDLPTESKLRRFLAKNRDRISFSDAQLEDLDSALRATKFTALADVPDIVWKERGPRKRGRESPNHFADMDHPAPTLGDKTLLDRCKDAGAMTIERWSEFYDALGTSKAQRGLLPFRVWQLFDAMVETIAVGDLTGYLCAAGILAHYVGDACQPLHVSSFHDGDPHTGEGQGVHSAYQTKMVDQFSAPLIQGVNQALAKVKLPKIRRGQQAAFETVQLMRRSVRSIPPRKLVEAYARSSGRGRTKALWDQFGAATIERMADGATLLAALWQGAWQNGSGSKIGIARLGAVPKASLRARYERDDFVPSVYLHMLEIDGDRLRVRLD